MKLKDDKRRLIIKGKEGKDYPIFNSIPAPTTKSCIYLIAMP